MFDTAPDWQEAHLRLLRTLPVRTVHGERNIPVQPKRSVQNVEQRWKQIAELHAQGLNNGEVAAIVGVERSTVSWALRAMQGRLKTRKAKKRC